MYLTHALRAIVRAVVATGDALWKYVGLLLSGTPSPATFISDASKGNQVITVNGDARPNGFNPYTPGYYSNYFSAGSNYLNTPSAIALSSDLTIELWFNLTSPQTNYQMICGQNLSGGTGTYLSVNSTGIEFYMGGGNVPRISYTFATNVWYHFALVRSGSTVSAYVNGVSQAVDFPTQTTTFYLQYFGISFSTAYPFTGYISNFRVVNGSAVYTSNFTPSTTPLTAITNTALLTCQSNRFIDNSASALALTVTGSPTVNSFQPFTPDPAYASYGSTYFDGTGDYLTVPFTSGFSFNTVNFTVEFWVRTTSTVPYACALRLGDTWTTGSWALYLNDSGGTGNPSWWAQVPYTLSTTGATVNDGAWHHIALVRLGSVFTIYIDGISRGTLTNSASVGDTTTQLWIGRDSSNVRELNGYLSNLRIVKGTALYTTNFVPPAIPLAATAETTLLTCQTSQPINNKTFLDESSNNLIITASGNATQGSFSPYGANWSNYFDGSGDYLNITTSTAFGFGTGDFTIEFWAYSTSTARQDWVDISDGTNRVLFYYTGSAVTFYGNGVTAITGAALVTNVWVHYALVKSSGSTKLYVNGTQAGSTYATNQNYGTTAAVSIGKDMFGSTYITGYLSNFRIVKGTAVYTAAFTPPTAPLTPIAGTSLLTCQSPSLVDNSINGFAITRNGDVSVRRFSPFSPVIQAPVSYSTYFDGSGDYLDLANNTVFSQTGSWTLEMWVYPTVAVNNYVYSQATANFLQINITATNYVNIDRSGVGNLIVSTNPISLNVWTHLALVSDGTNMKLFINGTQSGSTAAVGTQATSAAVTRIGAYQATGSLAYQGYISNLRLVKGTALYTANFTPPTAPLTAVAGTSLLTCQSPTIIDNSTNAFSITVSGNAIARSQNPFGFTNTTTGTAYTPALYGGSAYFDGTDDKLTIANYTGLAFGTNNFTIQGWFYTVASSVEQVFATNGWSSYAPWLIRIDSGNVLRLNMSLSGGSWYVSEVALASVVPGQWYHVAVTRSNGTLYAFINGVQQYTVSLPSALFDGSQALNVGGRSDTGVPFKGYISDFQLINGTALYTGGFVPPIAPLQAVKNTTLLLNMDKAAAVDSSKSVDLETVADTKIRYETPYAGSYYSNYFDGSGDYLTVPANTAFAFGTGDFTVEAWVDHLDSSVYSGYFYGNASGLVFRRTDTNKLELSQDGIASILVSTATVPANQWVHVAATRTGTTVRLFINGALDSSTTSSANFVSTGTAYIGSIAAISGYYMKGYMSNVRLVKGTAVYTANFTPPTAPLTAIANTSLLTCQSKSFVDNSSNNFTITRNGDVAVRSYNPFQATTNGSVYFDGSGDYLSVPANRQFMFGGNLTIEFWVYFTTVAGTQDLIGNYVSNVATDWIVIMSGTGIQFYPSGSSSYVYSGAGTAIANTWYHVAAVRSGSTCSLYVNGISVGTPLTVSTAVGDGTKPVYIGARSGPSSYFSGYIADLRITNGAARYTANFTPPTAPLPTS